MHPLRLVLPLFVLAMPALAGTGSGTDGVTPRQSAWYTASVIAEDTWGIVDHATVNCYLVLGRDRALLIDTGYGRANLRDYVRSLTSLPLTVLNTHGHPDHSGGNLQFGTVLAGRADFPMVERFANAAPERAKQPGQSGDEVPVGDRFDYGQEAEALDLRAVEEGTIIDLGGRQLEVIATPGHTPGEIVLLDRTNKLLFGGDHINRLVWLQLPGCLPLETYLANLEKLAARSAEFTQIMPGHHEPIEAAYLAELIACVKGILDKTIPDEPYKYGQTEGRIAKFERASVVFDPRNLRAGSH